MDAVISQLATYVSELKFGDLPPAVVRTASLRLADAVGCAIGGYDSETVSIARRMSPLVQAGPAAAPAGAPAASPAVAPARAIGDPVRTTTLEAAALTDAWMIRYLDFNDTYPGGHPSDALGPLIALADTIHASGEKLVTALVAAYDIFIRQASAAQLRERGWDQGFGIGLGAAAGASILLGLDLSQTAHALALSAVANIPMRATRAGTLSMWKGAATGYAARSGLVCALLAAEGMTGPGAPIDGRHGLKDLITGPFDLQPFDGSAESFLTHQAWVKYWPVENHLQGAVWAGIELRSLVAPEDVESVTISSYWAAWHETASEPEKWKPQTRETADHSMPYIFSRAFHHGTLDLESFEPAAYLDPAVHEFMARVSAHTDDDIEKEFPAKVIMRVTARTRGGAHHTVEIVNPRGHQDNPVTDTEAGEKFLRLTTPKYGPGRAGELLAAWTGIASISDVAIAHDLLNLPRPGRAPSGR